jgi:hypothetical protein
VSELRAGAPITLAGITLIPIERVRISAEKQRCACWLNATKEALAVVICDRDGPRALDVEAQELPIDELIGEIPDLEPVLAELLAP